jgi:phospholipid/cholesterol/gamma-HCH transport system substrate-binding protein
MSKPFKFRYVNEIAGGFVILVFVLLIAGIVVAGHAQRWFEKVHHVKIDFPPEGSLDLQKGAEVRILGTQVGSVDDITVAEDGSMTGTLSVRGDFFRFVRTDSQAIVRKKFGLAGDAYVDITRGTNAPLPEDQALICLKDTEILEMIQNVVQKVQDVTLPAIDQARKAMEEYTNLAEDLRKPEGNLQQLLDHLNRIAAGLEKGEGTAGQLLRDPALANELHAITGEIDQALGQVRQILDDVEQSMDVVKGEMQDVPGMVLQTRETMAETEKLVDAIQKHWLIRSYVEHNEPSKMIPPSEVGEKQ